ncbi:MAG: hypothetical protein EBR82_44490 [Caulobacteraceae bacterium]|nr:hypothetical protein [Caulobacteraceae bacterium]
MPLEVALFSCQCIDDVDDACDPAPAPPAPPVVPAVPPHVVTENEEPPPAPPADDVAFVPAFPLKEIFAPESIVSVPFTKNRYPPGAIDALFVIVRFS